LLHITMFFKQLYEAIRIRSSYQATAFNIIEAMVLYLFEPSL
jgi:hypothetical protein